MPEQPSPTPAPALVQEQSTNRLPPRTAGRLEPAFHVRAFDRVSWDELARRGVHLDNSYTIGFPSGEHLEAGRTTLEVHLFRERDVEGCTTGRIGIRFVGRPDGAGICRCTTGYVDQFSEVQYRRGIFFVTDARSARGFEVSDTDRFANQLLRRALGEGFQIGNRNWSDGSVALLNPDGVHFANVASRNQLAAALHAELRGFVLDIPCANGASWTLHRNRTPELFNLCRDAFQAGYRMELRRDPSNASFSVRLWNDRRQCIAELRGDAASIGRKLQDELRKRF